MPKINKNKFFLLILAIIFVLSLVACVPSNTDDNGNDDDNNPPVGDPGTPFTDATLLTRDYAGKDFFTDGIGVVTLVNCVDGDTAIFRSPSKGTFTVRFLGIDTPESTYKLEPWGMSASNFTKTKLTGATEIVLETEAPTPELDTTGDRYLAWAWVDGRLLNLELIEQSYTASKGVTGSKYQQTLYDADMRIQAYKLRIWGTEKDPAFDYSKQGIVRGRS
jgi:micrococcal nuclease